MKPSFIRSSDSSTTTSAFTFGSPSGSHKALPLSTGLLQLQIMVSNAVKKNAKFLFIKTFDWLNYAVFIICEFAYLEASEPCLSA